MKLKVTGKILAGVLVSTMCLSVIPAVEVQAKTKYKWVQASCTKYYMDSESQEFEQESSEVFKYNSKGDLVSDIFDYGREPIKNTYAYTYYKSGNGKGKCKTCKKNEDGYKAQMSYSYDKKGRLAKTTEKDEDGEVTTTTYTYNKSGQTTKIVSVLVMSEGSTKKVTKYTYNKKGKMTKVSSSGSLGAERSTESEVYTYNKKNVLVKCVQKHKTFSGESSRSTKTSTYYTSGKNKGQIQSMKVSGSGDKYTDYYDYTYNRQGLVKEQICKDKSGSITGKIVYTYTKVVAN